MAPCRTCFSCCLGVSWVMVHLEHSYHYSCRRCLRQSEKRTFLCCWLRLWPSSLLLLWPPLKLPPRALRLFLCCFCCFGLASFLLLWLVLSLPPRVLQFFLLLLLWAFGLGFLSGLLPWSSFLLWLALSLQPPVLRLCGIYFLAAAFVLAQMILLLLWHWLTFGPSSLLLWLPLILLPSPLLQNPLAFFLHGVSSVSSFMPWASALLMLTSASSCCWRWDWWWSPLSFLSHQHRFNSILFWASY